jgi:hypothetical protein
VSEPTLMVRVERSGAGRPRVLAPAVGRWSAPPRPGSVVGPGSIVGRLRCLNRGFVLVMPDGCAGTVDRATDTRVRPVAFGEVLFHLRPFAEETDAGAGQASTAKASGDLPEGAHAVCAR